MCYGWWLVTQLVTSCQISVFQQPVVQQQIASGTERCVCIPQAVLAEMWLEWVMDTPQVTE